MRELYLPEDYWRFQEQPADEARRIVAAQAGLELVEVDKALCAVGNGLEPLRGMHVPRFGVITVASSKDNPALESSFGWVDVRDMPSNTSVPARDLIESWLRNVIQTRA